MSLVDTFSDVYQNWRFGGWPESKSGPGSTEYETEILRNKLKQLVKNKKIRSIVDFPCGDFNWMKHIVYNFENYIGCDIVPQLIEDNQKYSNTIIKFIQADITKDTIPTGDLLLVRDILGHLSLNDGKKALDNILNSNCKFLLTTTWYNKEDKNYYLSHKNIDNDVSLQGNWERGAAAFYSVCIHSEPFNLPLPEFYIEESGLVDNYEHGVRKGLAFYNLNNLRDTLGIQSDITY